MKYVYCICFQLSTAVSVQDVRRILPSDAPLEILDNIGFRGNPSKADFTSKGQGLHFIVYKPE